jgi:hypothetical protein
MDRAPAVGSPAGALFDTLFAEVQLGAAGVFLWVIPPSTVLDPRKFISDFLGLWEIFDRNDLLFGGETLKVV